ncbi:helix-turn-helix domain-containing protein [Sphingobacterium faecale]|uniref:Helix-turn-helix transcriptional regulator n=1 Tax=Sphingobacterium faecale TaxID=2803775 RepID=A0ABS1R009_9SPHI|nr:AraC family transcriptional regulator [Sphingobacterium faecale]MBL1408008.1 helix-turn-helix transcriptional regulator [Sphingobacterium faecale]
MRLSAKLKQVDRYYIQKEIDDAYNRSTLLDESEVDIVEDRIGQITYKQMSCGGMLLIDVTMTLQQVMTDIFKIDGESVMMEFMFDSKIEADIDKLTHSTWDLANTHNITFSKNYHGRFKMPPNIPVQFLIIILSKEYYFNLIPKDYILHQEFVNNIFEQKTATLSKTMLQFNPYIHAVIHEIRSCTRKGELKRLYIENKIQELLLLQLEINQKQHLLYNKSGLNDRDHRKLLEAKNILDIGFRDAPGIPELARMSYLNEFKLKKGFKSCFGMTIKSYVISLRMRHAIDLLNEEKHSITEIAYLCGYNGIVQFSTAFKNFYGYAPSYAIR